MKLSLPDIDPARITNLTQASEAIRLLMNSFENLIQVFVKVKEEKETQALNLS